MKNTADIVSVSSIFQGAREAKITRYANEVLGVDLLEHGTLVRGQCFSGHRDGIGADLADKMADAWIDGDDMALPFDSAGRAR